MARRYNQRYSNKGNKKKKDGFWKWYWAQYRGKWYQRIITPIASFFVLFFLFMGAVDINFLWLFGESPSIDLLLNPKNSEASLIYSSDNVLIGKYYEENRRNVGYDDISPYVIQALISTEDERFYEHNGVDYKGIFGAMKDLILGNPRGASTITQQLAKNMFKMRETYTVEDVYDYDQDGRTADGQEVQQSVEHKNEKGRYTNGLLCKVPGVKMLIMKAKEWNTAYKLENMYTKKEIITMYLNTVDFGSNAYGIKTAAKTFFNVTPKELNIEQAATLIGLLKATSTYNPMINPENSLKRRNVVIENMLNHNMISQDEAQEAMNKPIELNYNSETAYDGQAQYFKQAVRDNLREWCEYNDVNLDTDGLKIYTTVDTRMQRYAEQAVLKQMNQLQNRFNEHWGNQEPWRDEHGRVLKNFIENIAKETTYYKQLQAKYLDNQDSINHYMNLPHKVKLFSYTGTNRTIERNMSAMDSIRYMQKFLHCGFVAIEPQTSYVKAWVGDVDFNTWQFDKVRTLRQPGSTFKLFVYATAMQNLGLVPMAKRLDTAQPIKYRDANNHISTWKVRNSGGHSSEQYITLRQAFAKSVNTVAARLGVEVGISNIITMAKRMGITTELQPTPAIALGACEVKLIDLVNAYACVVNEGMRRKPILVTKIFDRDGNLIYDCDNNVDKAEQVIQYRTAYFMLQLLQAGTHDPGGTSRSVFSFINPNVCDVGGKTGTTSNYSDAWFVGCTPNLVAGAWVGADRRSVHFRNGALGQGARTALPVFGYFMSKVLADNSLRKYRARFKPPKYNIPPSSYSVYTPEEETEDRPVRRQEVVTDNSESEPKPDNESKRKPQQDISQGIEVQNAEERQPKDPQIDEEFFK